MRLRCGVPRHLYTKPLTYGLEHNPERVELSVDLSSKIALRLKSNELHAALLTPIDYARNSSLYQIVPNICASSKSRTLTVLLHLRKALRKINTVAADIGLTSEFVLCKIILSEKYDTNPQFIPMMPARPTSNLPDVTQMLEKADAALIVGDPSVSDPLDNERTIDLVEEWADLTDVPYVHALWMKRQDALDAEDPGLFSHSLEEGLHHLREIASSAGKEHRLELEQCKSYLTAFNYSLNEEAAEGLSEFFRYAFYYGLLSEIPEIRFHPAERGPDIQLN